MKRVIIRVDNNVRLHMPDIPSEVLDKIKLAFTFDNPQYHLHRKLKIPGWWNAPQEIGTWGEEDDEIIIPRGGLREVRDILEANGIEYKLRDKRVEGGVVENFPTFLGIEGSQKGYDDLHYYQRDAIEAVLKRENCVVRLPTGSGKSVMAIALATRIGLNTLVILPTVGLFQQWIEDAAQVLDTEDIGIIHRKKRKLRPITATVQGTLAKGISQDILDYFGVVIVDECQKAAASTYMRVVGAFPSRYRIGISADERRQDKKEFLTKGLFGEVVYEKKRKELEDEGYIVDVEIRVVPTNFEADWYGMPPDKKKSEEDEEDEEVSEEDQKEIDFGRLLDEMKGDERRNSLALKCALTEVENGEQVLMLSHRREHCIELEREFVKRGIASGYFIGGADYSTEFEKTRAGIKDGSIRVGVGTYGALGVGVNLPKVGSGVAVTPIAGNRFQFNQVRGRLNRKGKGKSRAVLYAIWDQKVHPNHLKNMVSWNPTVKVLSKGKWIEGRHYLKALRKKSEWSVEG